MRLRTKFAIALVIFLFTIAINWNSIEENVKESQKDTEYLEEGKIILQETTAEPEIYFCPRDDCIGNMVAWLDAAEEYIHCALYEAELQELKDKLVEKSKTIDVKLVTDTDNMKEVINLTFVRQDNKSAIMHNKFCILDGKAVWTGSFNPTERCNYKNNNNAIFYQSQLLAKNYEDEFLEMWNGTFEKGARTEEPTVTINGKNISSYFCPEDWCANKVIYELQDAKESVYFMTFSFTHDEVGKQLISLHDKGVEIKGVFEKSQNNSYTEYYPLKDAGIDVRWDGNKYNLHHKVFIIDNSTVITGSFNPSSNADERNDENLLIIHDPAVAKRYLEEFEYVWEEANKK